MIEQLKENTWWDDKEVFQLIFRAVKSGKLDIVKRKFERLNAAIDNGADVSKINDFVMEGKFNGNNIDELIEQAM